MPPMDSEKVDVKAIKKLYRSNELAKFLFDHWAQRSRCATATNVATVERQLNQDGASHLKGAIWELFRQLEALNCGKAVVGRRGHPSRFEWGVSQISVGNAASDKDGSIEALPADAENSEEDNDLDSISPDTFVTAATQTRYVAPSRENFISHTYRLRRDLEVNLSLPSDLSANEAHRLAEFIRTLPFDEASRA